MQMEADETRRRRHPSGEREPLILYARNGHPVYVPPEVADLFRDLPPEDREPLAFEDDDDVFNCDEDSSGRGGSNLRLLILSHY